MLRLVEEGRDPRQERDRTRDERDDPRPGGMTSVGVRPPPRLPDQQRRDHCDQVEGPVVRVQQQAGDERDDGLAAEGRSFEESPDGQVPERHEQHHERVHARLGAVADGER